MVSELNSCDIIDILYESCASLLNENAHEDCVVIFCAGVSDCLSLVLEVSLYMFVYA